MRRFLLPLLLLPTLAAASDLGPSEVTVSGRQLIVRKRLPDGALAPAAPYVIRGMVWSPASTTTNTSNSDPNNAAVRRAEFDIWKNTDVPLLAAMNVNTVRMLVDPGTDATADAILDLLHENGIMVIMNVDNGVADLTRVEQVVSHHKNHPAVLMWMIGNEWNIFYHFNSSSNVQEAARKTQAAAALAKSLDPAHPVGSSYGEIHIEDAGRRLHDSRHYINDVCVSVDVWALNIYRGRSFGTLFEQWATLSPKPMLIGEYGTDAFRSAGSVSAGSIDGVMQADWDVAQWNEIVRNLSANAPEAVSLGGSVFSSSDEWWKVSPSGSQQTGGFAGNHPDGFSNEEWYGAHDIARAARPLRDALAAAFAPSYAPQSNAWRVISRGARAEEYSSEYGTTWMFHDGGSIFSIRGNTPGGGRGIHIAAIDPSTGLLQGPVRRFDTWAAQHGSSDAFCQMNTFLDGIADGMLILLGVTDEGGLTNFDSCTPRNESFGCAPGFRQRMTALGSQQVSSYCYRDSWAFAAVKGEGVARAEQRNTQAGAAGEAAARTTLPTPMRTLTLTIAGQGTVRSTPTGLECASSCTTPMPYDETVTLHATPTSGWYFSGWSAPCSGVVTCALEMEANQTITATFVQGPSVTPRSASADPSGETLTLIVDASGAWTATSNVAWATLRTFPGRVLVDVEPGNGTARDGTLTIAGRTIALAQRRGAAIATSGAQAGLSGLSMSGTVAGPAGVTRIDYSITGAANAVGTVQPNGGQWSISIPFAKGVSTVVVSTIDAEGNSSRLAVPVVQSVWSAATR